MVLIGLVVFLTLGLGATGASPWWILPLSGILVLYYHFILGWDGVVGSRLRGRTRRGALGVAVAVGIVSAIFYFWRLVFWLAEYLSAGNGTA